MGKISKKIIKNFRKLRLNKVINLSESKKTSKRIAEINAEIEKKLDVAVTNDPSHKAYAAIQNLVSFFAEEVSDQDDFEKYYDAAVNGEDVYMFSFPPMSPLTASYFGYVVFFDLALGKKRSKDKETIGTVFYDLGQALGFDKMYLKTLENINASYMGFYEHLGFEDNLIILKEILTDKVVHCICNSGYNGKKGEIWFIRLAPNLDNVYNYSVNLTTPYVIINSTPKDWLDFFRRQKIVPGKLNFEEKYYRFMTHNSDEDYWHEYIMDSYSNYNSGCVFLTGFPDIKGSKPHERGNLFGF